jgi:hypothetical protein
MSVDLSKTFAGWRQQHARRSWKPVCGSAGRVARGQFGGSPLMIAGERWPICDACHAPMQFFLQLSIADMPPAFGARGEGQLQMFYCSKDAGKCETWSAFSGTHLVRLLSQPATTAPHPAGLKPLPMRTIEGWRELLDYPNPQEHRELGIEYEYHSQYTRTNVSCRALGIDLRDLEDDDVAEAISTAEAGDKLGGWPHWIQGIEYPSCPRCKRRMELVFQLASEDNLPYMFGDVGIGHITQCPEHADVLTFAWACS